MLDGRTKYEQILGVLHVPASVKRLLADAHSTTSQLHVVVRRFWIVAAILLFYLWYGRSRKIGQIGNNIRVSLVVLS